MKNSVLASLLFGALAAAAPVEKRDLVYKTEVVTETVVVYTTVWDDGNVAQATTTPAGYFYEQPKEPSSTKASSSKAAAPSSAYVAPPAPQAPSPTPAPAPSPAPAPAPQAASPSPAAVQQQPQQQTVEQPKPTTAAAAPAPASPSPAPAAQSPAPSNNQPSSGGSTTGQTYSNVDMTIYDNNGGFGACGTALHDGDMIVALAKDAWGASTYDVMTGEATNPWCGQKIKVDYNGNSIEATIMDLCPGCSGHDIDLSLAAWTKLTGMAEKTRLKASWSKIA